MKKTPPQAFTTQRTTQEQTQPPQLDAIPEVTHPSKSTRAINKIVLGALVIIAAALAIMLYWALQPTDVLTVKNAPFPVRTIRQHAEQGGVIILKVDLCKNSSVTGETRTSFVSDSREVLLPLAPEKLPKGCLNQEVPIVVPKDLPVDNYKIKFRVTYDINPLKKGVVNEFESQSFPVDPNLPTTP